MTNPQDSNLGGQLAYVEPTGGHVELDGVSLVLDQKTYRKYPTQPFAPKSSSGAPAYDSYSQHVTPASQNNWVGGYGTSRARGGDDQVEYWEGFNVDPGIDGRVTISPEINYETLPGLTSTYTPVSITELNGTLLALAGTALYYRTDATAMWTACGTVLPGTPSSLQPFGTNVYVALGEGTNMRYTGNFSAFGTTEPARALTADKSALYRAFNTNLVQASTSGTAWTEGTATVGDSSAPITAMLPGGGLIELSVGKTDGFWAIPTGGSGTATNYLPFDRRFSRNCLGMVYNGVPIAIPNGRGLWDFSLSSISGGQAENISPGWNAQEIGQVRGEIRALSTSMRWLYAALNDAAPDAGTVASYINRRDSRTGRWHTWLALGSVPCQAMYYRPTQTPSAIQAANPTLWFGAGTQIAYVTLPINSDDPLADANTRYNTSLDNVYLDFPRWDFGLPDEDKTLLSIRVMSAGITGAMRNISIEFQLDGQGAWRTDLTPNTAYSSPRSELFFPHGNNTQIRCRYIGLRARLKTDNPHFTPQLVALVARCRVNVTNLWGWKGSATIAKGQQLLTGAVPFTDTVNVKAQLEALRENATTCIFKDRDGKQYDVQVSDIQIGWVEEPNKDTEWFIDFDVYQANEGLATGYMAIYGEPGFGEYPAVYGGDSYYYDRDGSES